MHISLGVLWVLRWFPASHQMGILATTMFHLKKYGALLPIRCPPADTTLHRLSGASWWMLPLSSSFGALLAVRLRPSYSTLSSLLGSLLVILRTSGHSIKSKSLDALIVVSYPPSHPKHFWPLGNFVVRSIFNSSGRAASGQ